MSFGRGWGRGRRRSREGKKRESRERKKRRSRERKRNMLR